ncbi:MAG: type II toxin-antitoxin system Phd/YefM family antitoxin [Roseburia sp.]|nr:type II toxin-antitoxin system Phd/YefM family antitoxin [Anaeroplasma bactoclasticum]MCM1196780.1 type II toxin-antitoxin system Phd/YefM family antitoxin [Roseburia sp.]MCM1556101.1 type II toxin-antitoxin system Phd/YefM family antitoxin [Anaeroplasma bactoclasticum]
MPQIIPIRDLRDTTKISEMCNAVNEPIFITKNGYGDMVIMSVSAYEQQLALVDMYVKIMAGKVQADSGELLDGPETMLKLRAKYAK